MRIQYRFNSIVVRLKAGDVGPQGPQGPRFNSIVVRLKAERRQTCNPVFVPFQFHSGSIKR